METRDSVKVLVDTSAWIDYFRKKEPAYSTVSKLLTEDRICCMGIVIAELLQGAKSEKEVTILKDFVNIFDFLPETLQLWEQAGELSSSLRRKGITVGLSDCFIAVNSVYYDVELLTFDTDFKAIKDEVKLTLYTFTA